MICHNSLFPDPLIVEVNPLNTTALSISWVVPMAVHNQGFQSVVVNVQSECFTGVALMPPQIFTITDNSTTGLIAGSLGIYYIDYRLYLEYTMSSNQAIGQIDSFNLV